MTSTLETTSAPATEAPKANGKARAGGRRAHVAPKKANARKKANPKKTAPKGAQKAGTAQKGSKTSAILDSLKRPGGVTAKELMKMTGWQPHSVRGFLSGTVAKKMGLMITSSKGENGERSYSVKA